MADDRTRPLQPGRLDARTSGRIDRMTEDEREELARALAGRSGVVAKPKRGAPAGEEEIALEAARLTAELRRTERRLDRFSRTFSSGRYQTGGASAPNGRHARLLSRADRLARELRSLR
jgi:hypothetical protein